MEGARSPLKEISAEASLFSVGDRVIVDRIYTGVVRYIGRVGTKKHSSLGIELDTSNGENNGSRAGRVYFQCRPRHGVFRECKDVKKYRPQDYNQTGIINTTEIEEIPNTKAVSELLNDNMEMQRTLEELSKQNKRLKEDLEKEREKTEQLENVIRRIREKEAVFAGTATVQESAIKILSEIVGKIKEKIETENKIFLEMSKA